MPGGRLREWERRLRKVFDRIDAYLEARYGDRYPLRPNRAEHGETANCKYDGLFEVDGKFTVGIGSEHGSGYTVEVRLATFSPVPARVREQIMDDVVDILKQELPKAFPGRELQVSKEGSMYKIHGDLSL